MVVQMLDEDAIDTEALQAQIDMSMSFAQDLVASWVKPSHKLVSGSHKDTESELKEYMRRPPRLGVGAAIPETASLSRETARLKGHLTNRAGSKRVREEDDDVKRPATDDEDEDSRAGAIQKKVKLDPFRGIGKGDKKKDVEPRNPLIMNSKLSHSASSHVDRNDGREAEGLEAQPTDSQPGSPSPKKKRKKNRKKSSLGLLNTGPLPALPKLPFLFSSPDVSHKAPTNNTISSLPEPLSPKRSRKKNRKKGLLGPLNTAPLPTSPISSDPIDPNPGAKLVGLVSTTLPKDEPPESSVSSKSPEVLDGAFKSIPGTLPPALQHILKQPLLNLDGPPIVDEDLDIGEKHGVLETNPNKKRRRRKKKKTLANRISDGIFQ